MQFVWKLLKENVNCKITVNVIFKIVQNILIVFTSFVMSFYMNYA